MDTRTGVFVLLCLIGFTCEEMVPFKPCASPSGKVSSVDVVPCNTEPCHIRRGHDYTVTVTFTSGVESKTSEAVVHGLLFNVPVPWPIPQHDGCKSGVQCPIQKKKTYTYVGTLPVNPTYPLVQVDVRWKLTDDHYNNLFCITFPVQIVK